MELINRYIQAVGMLLPKQQKQDILAELEEDIRSQVDDQQATLGRPLTDAEVSKLLKERGSPLKVAAGYGPQQWLIGPELFPAYWLVLRIVLAVFGAFWVVTWIMMLAISAQYRADHSGLLMGLPPVELAAALFALAAKITLGFAILERVNARTGILEKWEPSQLPAVVSAPKLKPPTRLGSAIELAFSLVATGWWVQALTNPNTWEFSGVRITLLPVWHPVFWALLALAVFTMIMSLDNLVRPIRTAARRSARAAGEIVRNLTTIGVMILLARAPSLLAVSGANMSAEQAAELTRVTNLGLTTAFTVTAVVVSIVTMINVGKLIYGNWAGKATGAGAAVRTVC